MNLVTIKSFRDEVEKIAARRGLKEISNLLAKGEHGAAAALAKKPGVLKPGVGHQIRDLGKGSEGLATQVAHPQHGIAVQKIYDPKGIASQELIARKEQAGKALQNNPHVAQFHGSQQGKGGTTAHTMEHVPGQQPAATVGGKRNPAISEATKGVAKGMRQAGFAGAADVRPENMVQTPSGKVKAIDYIPTQKGEFASGNVRNRISQQMVAGGGRPLTKNIQVQAGGTSPVKDPTGSMSPGQLKALHFRGVQPAAPKPMASQPHMQQGASPVPTKLDKPMAPTRPMAAPAGQAQVAPTRPMKIRPAV